jgi:hypothetical protein
VDYIFAIAFATGVLVSSLYGVPFIMKSSHGIGIALKALAFTVIPESSSRDFPRELQLIPTVSSV